MFAQLIREEGLPDSKTPIHEEETILAMAHSLAQAMTKGHPYNTCKDSILSALLEVPNETLKQWKKGPIFICEKAYVSGQEPRKPNPLEPQSPGLTAAVKDICNMMTACQDKADMITQHTQQQLVESER